MSEAEWEYLGVTAAGDTWWSHTQNPEAFSMDGGKTYFILTEPLQIDGSPMHYDAQKRPVPHFDNDKENPSG